ncbi:MAG: carbohydrate kinase family protein [Candidatus Thorarchaeota archaeon]|nr:carbohydrate kinase family protein [Candidatus Thorarchaeota archaeon]
MELVVVGHLSRDLLITPTTTKEALGGGTAYAMIAPSIGVSSGIVTKVGDDFETNYHKTLESSGLNLTGLIADGKRTTRFVNKYDPVGNRTQFVEAIAPQILPEDFSQQHLESKIIHFSPLTAHDIHPTCIEQAHNTGALTSIDVQGYLRAIDKGGQVIAQEWSHHDNILKMVDVVKFHQDELQMTLRAESEPSAVKAILDLGPKIILVTRDLRGSTIYTREGYVDIPLIPANVQVDTTGCGDTYTIGFLVDYLHSGDVRHAGFFAATCSSFNVETLGPYGMPSRGDVDSRMKRYFTT